MARGPGDYVGEAIESHVGNGKFQHCYVSALCLTFGLTPIHTYSNMFAAMEPTWHRACPGDDLQQGSRVKGEAPSCSEVPLKSPENCSVPLSQWEVDTPGQSLIGDFKLECERHDKVPQLGSLYFIGYAIGTLACGEIADMIGRRWAYLLGYAILTVGGFLAPCATSWTIYAAARMMIGAGVGSIGLSSYVWAMEFLGTSSRGVMSWLPNVTFSFGQILATPFGYYFPEWRACLLGCHIASLVGLTYWYYTRESPQWLASVGRMGEAHKVLCDMARMNGRTVAPPLPPAESPVASSDAETTTGSPTSPATKGRDSIFSLCDSRLRLRMAVMCVNWFSIAFAFYGVSLFSPDLPFSVYTANILSAVVPIPFYIIAPVLIDARWCGRKGAIAGSYFLGGGLLLFSTWCKEQWLSMTVYYAASGALSFAFAVLYVWAAELFPTDIRTRAMSVQSICGRAGAIVSPFVIDIGRENMSLALCIFAAPCLVSGVLDMLLPETRGVPLPATVADLDKRRMGSTSLKEPLI